jgi:hypothetical protein
MDASLNPQVPASHYQFLRYVHFPRWASFWHQARAVLSLEPRRVLEVGIGRGYLSHLFERDGVEAVRMDIDPALGPDVVGDVRRIPMEDGAVDVACAFEVLEHIPFGEVRGALAELMRVSRKGVVVSVPDDRGAFPFLLSVPGVGRYRFLVPKPRPLLSHAFDGEHYWELNTRETRLRDFVRESKDLKFPLASHGLCVDNPDHHFFSFHA